MTTSQCSRVLLRWRALTALLVLGAFGSADTTAWSQNAASQERAEGLALVTNRSAIHFLRRTGNAFRIPSCVRQQRTRAEEFSVSHRQLAGIL